MTNLFLTQGAGKNRDCSSLLLYAQDISAVLYYKQYEFIILILYMNKITMKTELC